MHLQPRFLVDSMLGRLCRWLRALGVDAQFVDPGGTLQQRQQLSSSDRQQQQQLLIQQIQEAALQEVGTKVVMNPCLSVCRVLEGRGSVVCLLVAVCLRGCNMYMYSQPVALMKLSVKRQALQQESCKNWFYSSIRCKMAVPVFGSADRRF